MPKERPTTWAITSAMRIFYQAGNQSTSQKKKCLETIKVILEEVRPWLTPTLTLIAGVYIRSILLKIGKIDKLDPLIEKVIELQKVREEWVQAQIKLAVISVKLEDAADKFEQLIILERNLATAFKQIDALKGKVNFNEETQGPGNKG